MGSMLQQAIRNNPTAVQQSMMDVGNIGDVSTVRNILWAEAANDPEGWVAKLNTYYKAMRGKEKLSDTMKRVSSAYSGNSPQYQLASGNKFRGSEVPINERMLGVIKGFQPDPKWQYQYHENPDLPVYANQAFKDKISNEQAMLNELPNHWGESADYGNRKRIGKEFYFPPTKRQPMYKAPIITESIPSKPMVSKGKFGEAFGRAFKSGVKTFYFDKGDGRGPQLYTTLKAAVKK